MYMKSVIVGEVGGDIVALEEMTREEFSRGAAEDVVKDALQKASDGGSVRLLAGEYEMRTPLEVPSGVRFEGTGKGTRIVASIGFCGEALLICNSGSQTEIANLLLDGRFSESAPVGLLLEDCGDCVVDGVLALGFSDHGIALRDHCFMCRVSGCSTSGNGRSGIAIQKAANGGRGGDYVPNSITGCSSYCELGSGFELEHALCVNLTACQVFQAERHGFLVHETSNSACLSGCRAFECSGSGVYVKDSHEINISSSIFCWNLSHGIELNHAIWGTVSSNNIIDSGGCHGDSVHGIYLHTDTRSIQVSGNAIFSWDGHIPMLAGIFENDDCQDCSFVGNNINYCNEVTGIVCRGKNSMEQGNYCRAEKHIHPEKEPFAPDKPGRKAKEFTLDRIKSFMNDIGRNRGMAAAAEGVD